MPYFLEDPFDRIVDVHWKKKPDDGGGGEPPVYPPPNCGGWSYTGDVGVSIIYVSIAAAHRAAGPDGTYIQPTDMPPIDWAQIGPPQGNNTVRGAQVYVAGVGSDGVHIRITESPGTLVWWVWPGKAWTDPTIWQFPYSLPSGPPHGTGSFDQIIPSASNHPGPVDPNNPNNLGTTIQLGVHATGTSGPHIWTVSIDHTSCPAGSLPYVSVPPVPV
jgi:hypothetical protein